MCVELKLDAIGYTIPEGDSLLLMIAPGSFPTIWPSPLASSITVHGGQLKVPSFDIATLDAGSIFAREDMLPRLGPSKKVEVTRQDKYSRELTYGLSDNKKSIIIISDAGCKYFPDVDTEIDEVFKDVYSITGDDPLSAETYCHRSCKITYQV